MEKAWKRSLQICFENLKDAITYTRSLHMLLGISIYKYFASYVLFGIMEKCVNLFKHKRRYSNFICYIFVRK